LIGPRKVSLKITPFGCPPLPTLTTRNIESTLEKKPPVKILPLNRAPVENETEPSECLGTIPLNLQSSEPFGYHIGGGDRRRTELVDEVNSVGPREDLQGQ
jgi:hypothetical protein